MWTSKDEHEHASIRPLTDAELRQVFGTDFPTAADFDRVQDSEAGPLDELMGERWNGRTLLIHTDRTPVEVYFWSWSGD